MLGRNAKAGVLVAALLILAVEGVLLYRYYDRYYGNDAPGAPSSGAPAFEATMPEGTVPEGTALDRTTTMGQPEPQETTTAESEAPKNARASEDEAPEGTATPFVHRATGKNSRGDYTYLSDPAIDADPGAVVLVSSEDAGGEDYGHNVGVWYESVRRKWAIFNQDLAAVPAGAAFRVVLPPASESFVHRATGGNTVGNATFLDDPLTNGKADAALSVSQNWNPGGGAGVYNDHPVGALYDQDVRKWAVYNRDGARMPGGAAFNVAVSGDT